MAEIELSAGRSSWRWRRHWSTTPCSFSRSSTLSVFQAVGERGGGAARAARPAARVSKTRRMRHHDALADAGCASAVPSGAQRLQQPDDAVGERQHHCWSISLVRRDGEDGAALRQHGRRQLGRTAGSRCRGEAVFAALRGDAGQRALGRLEAGLRDSRARRDGPPRTPARIGHLPRLQVGEIEGRAAAASETTTLAGSRTGTPERSGW